MLSEPPDFPSLDNLVGAIERIRNRYDAYDVMRDIGRFADYAHYALFSTPAERDARLADLMVVGNWPASLLRDYDASGLLPTSGTLARSRRSLIPFAWDSSSPTNMRRAQEAEKARDLFSRHGLVRGVIVPLCGLKAKHYTFALAGDREQPDICETARLFLLGAHLAQRMTDIQSTEEVADQQVRLSERERQCMIWTSAGKTSQEIGTILGLSEHTVNQYVTSCCQKLGAVNRTQAVAKAIRLALID